MARKNDTTNLSELLLRCMGEADPMLSMLEWGTVNSFAQNDLPPGQRQLTDG